MPLVCHCHRFPLFHLYDNPIHLCSLQGLVAVELLDNFLNLLKAFFGYDERSLEIAERHHDGDWRVLCEKAEIGNSYSQSADRGRGGSLKKPSAKKTVL